MPLTFGDQVVPQAGIYIQLGLTVLALGLMFFLPSNARIMTLENSHRRFHMTMRDVARAYSASHRADREGVFTLSSEFDSVRERIAYLRDHPDLGDLEPSVLEAAAQMSHVSRELADVYSDSKVQRARDFLTARQQELEDFNIRLEQAKRVANEIRTWHMRVELEEDVAESQLSRLRDELEGILPEIQVSQPQERAHNVAALRDAQSGWVRGPEREESHAQEPVQADPMVAVITRRAAE
ncbi:DNA repair protein [Salipiger bermudensis]|uniref:DNA repair protein n=1 Tax=Salipiger bermudensis TaxID=344736 RepID=UPI001CD49842|nr:DNA repair protein [Salipiger bermudensis]MCA0961111.1 DNA repair protein [Salipiger bermudensis]